MRYKFVIGVFLLLALVSFVFLANGFDFLNNSQNIENNSNSNPDDNIRENPKIRNDLPEELQDFREKAERQAKEYPGTFYLHGEGEEKSIALTFDDGPDEINTSRALDILKENNIKATFFLLGERIEEFPELTKRIYDEGHEIANHSWSHPRFDQLEARYILEEELLPTSKIVEEKTGFFPKIVRPPFGSINDDTIELLKDDNWKVVNWSIDSFDWHISENSPAEIEKDRKLSPSRWYYITT
ncbi:polysaccharide deacetylase family protein [Natronospora cellulosivora (SeqCode)]